MEAPLIDDAPAGATGPVHNTTLVDGEDCRLKDTYGKFLISGYIVGIRDYLAGPRLEGFARGADETGHTLLATSDRATLIDAVQDVRHKLSLEPADAHALRMVTAMLCANPPVCTVHGALLALVLDRWGLDEKDVMQEIIFHLQHVPAQRAPIRQVVELCLQPISGEQLEVLLAETLQSQFPISFIDRDQLTNFASSSTYGSDALVPIPPPQSSDRGSTSGQNSNLCAAPDSSSFPSLAHPTVGGTSSGAVAPQSSASSSTYGFGASYSPYRVPPQSSCGPPAGHYGNSRSESAQLSASGTVPFGTVGGQHLSFTTPQQLRGAPPPPSTGPVHSGRATPTPAAPPSVTLDAGCTWTGTVASTGLQQGAVFNPSLLGEGWNNPLITVMSSPVQGDVARVQVTNNSDATLVLPLSIPEVEGTLRSLDSALREGLRSLVTTLSAAFGSAFDPVPLLLELQGIHRMPPFPDGSTLRDMVLLVRSGIYEGLTFLEAVDRSGYDIMELFEMVRRARIQEGRVESGLPIGVRRTAAGDASREARQRVQQSSAKSAARSLQPSSSPAAPSVLREERIVGDAGRVPGRVPVRYGAGRVGAGDVDLGLDLLASCASSASLAVPGHSDDEGDDPERPPYGLSEARPSYPAFDEPASRGRSTSRCSSRDSYSRSGSRGLESRSRSPERERHVRITEGPHAAGSGEAFSMAAVERVGGSVSFPLQATL